MVAAPCQRERLQSVFIISKQAPPPQKKKMSVFLGTGLGLPTSCSAPASVSAYMVWETDIFGGKINAQNSTSFALHGDGGNPAVRKCFVAPIPVSTNLVDAQDQSIMSCANE